MRVLNVRANMHPVRGGGSAERASQISRVLATMPGIEVVHLSLALGAESEWTGKLEGVEIVILPALNERFQIPAPSSGKIETTVRKASIVHMTGHWSVLNALVYRSARAHAVPHVMCPAGALPIFGRSRTLKRAFQRVVGADMLRTAARHIAITDQEVPHLLAHGARADSVTVIPNGVAPEDFEYRDDGCFRRRFGLDEAPLVLFVGRLTPIKGADLLIEAFAAVKQRFPSHRLIIAGSDEGELPRLTELAERRGLAGRVHFIGHASGPTKSAAYHAAELLVIPSRQEAMSMVVLEGGATTTPFVATDRCGLDELAEIGGGIIVPATAEGLADGIAAALEDPAKLRQMGETLHAYTATNFSWNAIGSQLVALFDEAVTETNRCGQKVVAGAEPLD